MKDFLDFGEDLLENALRIGHVDGLTAEVGAKLDRGDLGAFRLVLDVFGDLNGVEFQPLLDAELGHGEGIDLANPASPQLEHDFLEEGAEHDRKIVLHVAHRLLDVLAAVRGVGLDVFSELAGVELEAALDELENNEGRERITDWRLNVNVLIHVDERRGLTAHDPY